jgi:hypothetical protein
MVATTPSFANATYGVLPSFAYKPKIAEEVQDDEEKKKVPLTPSEKSLPRTPSKSPSVNSMNPMYSPDDVEGAVGGYDPVPFNPYDVLAPRKRTPQETKEKYDMFNPVTTKVDLLDYESESPPPKKEKSGRRVSFSSDTLSSSPIVHDDSAPLWENVNPFTGAPVTTPKLGDVEKSALGQRRKKKRAEEMLEEDVIKEHPDAELKDSK